MLTKLISYLRVKKFLEQYRLSDKHYLIELANMLDRAEEDDKGYIRFSKEMCMDMSRSLRKIGNKMVVK